MYVSGYPDYCIDHVNIPITNHDFLHQTTKEDSPTNRSHPLILKPISLIQQFTLEQLLLTNDITQQTVLW